jgi:PAS domain S-box-containing protein
MAVVVTCVASVELAEYALRMNLGIDALFAVPFVGLDALYPGRMSGNTIACFFLICGAQVLMSKPDTGTDAGAATTAAVILKTLAGGIAFLALLGYVVGLKSAYGWTDSVGMSIRSCAGFLLIFIARIAALWQRDIVDKPRLPNWFVPFLTIAVVTIAISLIWIFSSPVARPFMLDPLYAALAHRRSIAMILSVGTLIVLGAISVLVAMRKAVLAHASEKKLSLVMENMSDGIMLMDTKGDVFYQNPASLRIRGFQQSNMNEFTNESQKVTWKAWDESGQLLDPSQWPVPRIIRGEQVKGEVLRVRRNDGHEFFAKCNGASIYNDGTLAFSYITIEDITNRRQAEREVRESEERFRTLANSIPQLAWMARANGFLFWYNQRWHDYTGTTAEQMEGWGWQSVHDPAVLPNVLSKWREAIALAQPFEMEFPLRGANGTFRNFLTRGQPIKDSEGRLVQWFGTCTDIDELKRMEQSLRVTKARLESTLEASSVWTWTWHIGSDRLIADEFTARMFSLEAGAAAKGLPVAAYLQVVHEKDRAVVADALERAIELCGAYDIEYRVRQSDGAFRWLQARGRVESDGAGHATYFHGAVIDITDRKLSELSLRENNQQLKRSNRDLEDFAYIASHDLKTPLGGIKSAALWLEEDLHDLSDESRKLLGLMRSRIKRMETLLDDLLTYSRVGRTDTAVRETKLEDIFRSIVEVLNPPAHIQVRVEGELPVIVTASAQLEQVLRNLINNAIKHHDKQHGEVVLSGKLVGDFVEFVVRDDGPGILPEFHDKIFQLFQTLKRRDEVEGTGMGLAIVKKLVERQNCRITVHSQGNGTGTQFRFQWPTSPSTIYARELTNA